MSTIIPQPAGASPFDAICELDEVDYFWSARKLHPLMGYTRWQDFQRALERAMAAARNTGADVEGLFRGSPEKSTGGRPRMDYRLSREAAYLVAMNGDPNKPEVAAAQAYFVQQTRAAELAQAKPMDELEVAERYVAALKANRALQAENAELTATNAKLSPKARVGELYEANKGITPTQFHKMWFPEVRHSDFFDHLYRRDYLIDQRNTRWNEKREEWKDGPEHGHPTAKGKRYFYLDPQLDRNGVRRQHTRVRPGDAEHDLVAALERDGLPSRSRPTIPGTNVRPIRPDQRASGDEFPF